MVSQGHNEFKTYRLRLQQNSYLYWILNLRPSVLIDGLVEESCNSIANALELHLFALTHWYTGSIAQYCNNSNVSTGVTSLLISSLYAYTDRLSRIHILIVFIVIHQCWIRLNMDESSVFYCQHSKSNPGITEIINTLKYYIYNNKNTISGWILSMPIHYSSTIYIIYII